MIPRKAPSRLEKIFRLAVSALVLLTAAFSGEAAAQEIRVERVGLQAPVGIAAAAAPAGAMLPGAGGISFGAPSALAPTALAPSAVSAAALLAVNPAPAAASGVFRPLAAEAAAPAAPSSRPVQNTGRRTGTALPSGVLARPAPDVSRRAAPSLETAALPAAAGPRSAETDRDGAQRDFSALLGERLAAGESSAPASEAAAASSVSPRPASFRLAPAAHTGSRFLAAVPAVLAFGAQPNFQALLHPSLATWHALSQAGYVAGNVGAAIFPLVQIYQTFHGKSTPKSRAIVGAAASLALGLICAPILHKTLWGVQNVFGGLTLLVPLFLGALKGRVKGSGLKETILITAGALAVSAAVYFAAAALLPSLLAAAFSPAAIAKIALAVQFATSAMFLWMFLPDVVSVLRGKTAGGFSPGFNMMFFLSAVGSMVWAVPSAWMNSGADQNTYRLIFAVNAIYALASFVSYWFARRESKPD